MTPRRRGLIEQFLESIQAFKRAMWAGKEACFRDFKLHPGQVRILYFVKHRGSVTVKDIAEVMGTTSSAATQLVESIVQAGYLERKHDPVDRRKVHVRLSEKGRAKFEKFRKDHLAWVGKLLSPLSDRELEQLISLHKRVVAKAAPTTPAFGHPSSGRRGRSLPTQPPLWQGRRSL